MKRCTKQTLIKYPEACPVTAWASVEGQLHFVHDVALPLVAPLGEGVPTSAYGPPPLASPWEWEVVSMLQNKVQSHSQLGPFPQL